MSLRANWHLGAIDDLTAASGDPMADIAELAEVGQVVDLSRSEAELVEELEGSLTHEGRFWEYADGLECKLKWLPEHVLQGGTGNSCFTCPHYTEDRDDPRSLICKLGRQQEQLVEGIDAVRTADAIDWAMVTAFESDLSSTEEMAEALLA